nr:unnamed protein product [Digitaria exilis]
MAENAQPGTRGQNHREAKLHLMARNASRTSRGDPERAWQDSTELAATPDFWQQQQPSERQASARRPDLQ